MKETPSKLRHLPPGSCKVGSLATARLHKNKPAKSADDRRKRIRNRKKLALENRSVGEDLIRDSFQHAKGV